MSALGEILQKRNTSALDRAVISFSIDYQGDGEDGEDAAAELLALRAELDITMPCGHKNRYLLTNGRGEIVKDNNGDARCLMCEMEKLKGSA